MKKILLVNANLVQQPYPVPPSGLCMIARSLNGFRVKVLDALQLSEDEFVAGVREFDPDFAGCSIRNVDSTSRETPDFYLPGIHSRIIAPLKKYCRGPVILGGSGFSIFPEAMLRYFGLNYGIVSGDGETLSALLQKLSSGEDPGEIPGLCTLSAGGEFALIPGNSYSNFILPAAVYDFIDCNPYLKRGAYGIRTKTGCSHQCVYCTYPGIEGREFILRKASDVVDEIRLAVEALGNVMFEFTDSTFNDPPGHAEAICGAVIDSGLKIRLRTMGINPANASPSLFNLMKRAGFVQMDCTPDTASAAMLKNLGKNFGKEQLTRAARYICESGLPAMWFFVFGGPGESRSSIRETFAFIRQNIPVYDMVYISGGLRIYPGTPLQRLAISQGLIKETDSLLQPVYYENPEFHYAEMMKFIRECRGNMANVLFSNETRVDEALMKKAMLWREQHPDEEPFFRTLLRLKAGLNPGNG